MKDSGKAGEYLEGAKAESTAMASRALLLPPLASLPSEFGEFEKILQEWKGTRGTKRAGEGSGEGSEERRKRVRKVLEGGSE